MYKVVFHIVEKNKWGMVLKNAQNIKNAMPTTEIVIISVGESILGYSTDTDIKADLEAAKTLEIDLIACNNSLEAFEVAKEDLLEIVEVVPAGMVEMVKRQADGYFYIRP